MGGKATEDHFQVRNPTINTLMKINTVSRVWDKKNAINNKPTTSQ